MIKNKKNGFTLIELIATIALLAILATVILLNMVGVKTTEENRNADRFKKNVEEAACAFIDMMDNNNRRNTCKRNTNGCDIYLSELISSSILNESLISEDVVDPYTNKKAGSEKNCIFVNVKWEQNGSNKQKKCEMKRGSGCQ